MLDAYVNDLKLRLNARLEAARQELESDVDHDKANRLRGRAAAYRDALLDIDEIEANHAEPSDGPPAAQERKQPSARLYGRRAA